MKFIKEAFSISLLKEGFPYRETQNTDNLLEFEFSSGSYDYVVSFENTGNYGWEMIFGVKTDDGIDTRMITNKSDDVIKILNTIFSDILKEFVSYSLKFDKSISIILAPQLMDGESPNMDPFQRKRGKLYTRAIKKNIDVDPFWKNLKVDFKMSSFEPKSIIMTVDQPNSPE
jgi:hypothetical protein